MKIRTGFVSNSSASSFLMYGISVDYLDFGNIKQEIKLKFPCQEDNGVGVWEYFESNKILKDAELSFWIGENGTVYIGLSFDAIGDDETGKQFKDKIRNRLKSIFHENFVDEGCQTYKEAWYS
jgi:hypothetical protein